MREHIYFFLVTCVMLAMCNSNKSYAGAVGDNDTVKWTATRPFGMVTITFFSFFFSKSDRNLVWVSLAITAELWNLGSFQLAQVRNAYTKTTDFDINFGIRVGWFCLLCTTPIEESVNSWLTVWNVLIDRFLSLQIFRFHNIWIVWLADSALYKMTNSLIYGFSDLTIYRLCDWQIPQFTDFVPIDRFCKPQIEIFLNWHIVWLWDFTEILQSTHWQIPQFMDHVIGRICKWQIS